jgi:hypothetical protein
MQSRPITRKVLCSISDNPVANRTRMPLTTWETRHTARNVYVTDVPRDVSLPPERWNAKSSDYTERTSLYLGQSASIDMGLHIGNGVSLHAADDTGDAPHRPNVYVTDALRAIVWRPSDGMQSRPITRKGLRSISDNPRRSTWDCTSETV